MKTHTGVYKPSPALTNSGFTPEVYGPAWLAQMPAVRTALGSRASLPAPGPVSPTDRIDSPTQEVTEETLGN